MDIKIPGIDNVISHFGEWPSFHDAEIVEVHLHRKDASWIKINAWHMTNKINEKGHYIKDKHATVIFNFKDIIDIELVDFSHQNVISSLDIEQVKEGYKLILWPCYGLSGYITAKDINISITPFNGV